MSGIGFGVVLISALFGGASVLAARWLSLNNLWIMAGTLGGSLVGLWWAYRRVGALLRQMAEDASASAPDETRSAEKEQIAKGAKRDLG